jgi:hypothetical protein
MLSKLMSWTETQKALVVEVKDRTSGIVDMVILIHIEFIVYPMREQKYMSQGMDMESKQ